MFISSKETTPLRPFNKQPTSFPEIIAPLLKVVDDITELTPISNENVAAIKKLPFLTYYPLTIDDPVFEDPTLNEGLFESTISFDIFSKIISDSMQRSNDLRIYLCDRYARQLLRKNAHIVIRDTTAPQIRSITDLPFNSVHHTGFDLTIQYFRNFKSPIDTISGVDGIENNLNNKEEN